jgi:transcriptional regulator with XRE-family HTH domain
MTAEPVDRLAAGQALLRLLRDNRGFRLAWIARQVGVSATLVSFWRTGRRAPTEVVFVQQKA